MHVRSKNKHIIITASSGKEFLAYNGTLSLRQGESATPVTFKKLQTETKQRTLHSKE